MKLNKLNDYMPTCCWHRGPVVNVGLGGELPETWQAAVTGGRDWAGGCGQMTEALCWCRATINDVLVMVLEIMMAGFCHHEGSSKDHFES